MKTFKPFVILAAVLSLFLLCCVISNHIQKTTGKQVNPIVLVGIVALATVAMNFSKINAKAKKGGYAFGVIGANIFDMTQLQIKTILHAAILQHFGWELNSAGQMVEVSPGSGREIPKFSDGSRIIRHDLFQIQYLTPTENNFKFFNVAQSPALPFNSNFVAAEPNDKDLHVFFGLVAELATGAAAGDGPSILAFGAAAAGDEEVINGLVTFEINKRKELEKQAWKQLFVNDDAIKNYLRFPKPIVWEPGSGQELELRLAAAYAAGTHKFAKLALVGYKLTR
jgi:hypothetical protein